MNDSVETLKELFRGYTGHEAAMIIRLAGAGSPRKYYRLADEGGFSAIGAVGADIRENEAFRRLAKDFRPYAPEVYTESADGTCYLQEDLGDTDLFSLLDNEDASPLIEESLRRLARIQTLPEDVWGTDVMHREFNARQVMWDLNYFKYEFVKPSDVAFDEDALEDDFAKVAERLTEVRDECRGFMYRDFQSRNVMITEGGPRFIDFQGGRKGPSLYDVVSLLWQAKANFDADFRRRMVDVYAEEYCALRQVSKDKLLQPLDLLVTFRTLQVLGAYGFRGLVERKAHFIGSIPYAMKNLRGLIDAGHLREYPELERLCREICCQARWQPDDYEGLTVRVFSFSYKKGYPEDLTGNGGGFMFDCRAMHNPGRYAEYKQLTGLDKPVRDFLEERGEIQPFIEHALALTGPAVNRYLQRGFRSLQIGFGCTGGQHRSVYSAQAVAERLADLYPEARILLIHREQGISEIINKGN